MKYLIIIILTIGMLLGCNVTKIDETCKLEIKCGVVRMLPMESTTPEGWYSIWRAKGMLTQWISTEQDIKDIQKLLKENKKLIEKKKKELKKKMDKEKKLNATI